MPKIKGKVVKNLVKEGKLYSLVRLDKQPKLGEVVSIKWGATRSNSQNSFYWIFLQFLLDAGLKDEYGTTDELHESLKAAFLSKQNSLGLLKIGSTTELAKDEFGEYLEKINREMADHGIDTSEFWKQYEEGQAVA